MCGIAIQGVARTYHAISYFGRKVLLGGWPDEAVAGEVDAHLLQWLPCEHNGAVLGSVEISPEEW